MAYDWYQAFFTRKVLPGLLKEMRPCAGCSGDDHAGFFVWLKESDRPLYEEIVLQDEKLCSIWMEKGDKERFKEVCRNWVGAHLSARPKYLAAMSAQPMQESLL